MVGKHNDVPNSDFDPKELKRGIEVEMEHTNDPDIALSIAKDHLSELKNYYTLLDKMEEEGKKMQVNASVSSKLRKIISHLGK
jgi:hypothetical protein